MGFHLSLLVCGRGIEGLSYIKKIDIYIYVHLYLLSTSIADFHLSQMGLESNLCDAMRSLYSYYSNNVTLFPRDSPFAAPISQPGDPPLPRGLRSWNRLTAENRFSPAPCPGVSLWFRVECSDCKENPKSQHISATPFSDWDLWINNGHEMVSLCVNNNCIKCTIDMGFSSFRRGEEGKKKD